MDNNNLSQQNQFNNTGMQMDNNMNMQPESNNLGMQNSIEQVQVNNNSQFQQPGNFAPQINRPQFDNVNNNGGGQPQFNNQGVQNLNPHGQMNNNLQPQVNNFSQPLNNQQNLVSPQDSSKKIDFMNNKKLLYIVVGVVLFLIVGVVLYFTVFKKEDTYTDYNEYLKEQDKIKEKINKNYSLKDYKIMDGILVELKNDNSVLVDADLKIEFYDENENIVDVEEAYMFSVPADKIGYTKIYVDEDLVYSTYKVIAKLEKSPYDKSYHDKVTIVSSNEKNDNYIVQLRNDSDTKLKDVEFGIFFIGANNSIISYQSETLYDVEAGETVSEKIYIPYDEDYRDKIDYERIEVKILNAVAD